MDSEHSDSGKAEVPTGTGTQTTVVVDGEAHVETRPTLPIGTQLGRYRTIDILGIGGMGVVYKADDPELERHVAVKVVRLKKTSEPEAAQGRKQLLQEARALAKLSHPNVVAVYDVGTVGDDVFVAMELAEGTTLRRWLKEKERSMDEILSVFIDAGRGLAAAHGAGLVHRDFKPSNVLVCNDGRVRVVNFGIAQIAHPPRMELAESTIETGDSTGDDASGVTRTVKGTPAFMAREQHLSLEQTAHTDQFSFCVSLYSALYGKHPFVGHGMQRRLNVISGAVREAPPDAHVPLRLRRILLRGLKPLPAERYPDMNALLTELARPPLRARLARALVTVGVTLAIVALLTSAVLAWRRHVAEQDRLAREQAAQARLLAVEERISELTTAGRLVDADEAFLAFVNLPEHSGTRALTTGWLRRGERAKNRDDSQEELRSYANGYTVAHDTGQQTRALIAIARVFHRRGAWAQLEVVLETLDAKAGDRTLAPDVEDMRLRVALARRDLVRAGAIWTAARGATGAGVDVALGAAPIVEALAVGTQTSHLADRAFVVDADGQGELEVVLHSAEQATIVVARADRTLTEEWTLALEPQLRRPVVVDVVTEKTGEPALLVGVQSGGEGGATGFLARPSRGGLKVLHQWHRQRLSSAAAADLDGDGRAEIYLGFGPYERKLLRLDSGPQGYRLVEPDVAINRAESDVQQILVTDLNRDGADELTVALGPWRAYDIRVMTRGASGALELAARSKLGYVSGLATMAGSRGGKRTLVALKSNIFPSKVAFPADQPSGAQPGVYVFELVDGELRQLQYLPTEDNAAHRERVHSDSLMVGDFDGDGLQDIVLANYAQPSTGRVQFHRQQSDGTFASVAVSGVQILAVANLDDDPADELLVRLGPDDKRVWILGAGMQPVPMLQREKPMSLPSAVPPAVIADTVMSRSWERAEDLVSMGLQEQAAEVFEKLAALSRGTRIQNLAQKRAGELWESFGRDERAAQRYEEAADDPGIAMGALEGAARALVREHRFADALRISERQLRLSELDDEARLQVQSRKEWLAPLAKDAYRLAFDFDQPMSNAWHIHAPLSLRRDARNRSLGIDSFGDQDVIAAFPIYRLSDIVSVRVRMDIARTEWASGVRIVVRPEGSRDADMIGVGVAAWGGGAILERQIGCFGPTKGSLFGPRELITGAGETESVDIFVELVPALSEVLCVITDDNGVEIHRSHKKISTSLPHGPYELSIENAGDRGVPHPLWSAVSVHSIVVEGVNIRAPRVNSLVQGGHQLFVEGEAARALQVYQRSTPKTAASVVGRIVSLERLGRHQKAVTLLRSAVGEPQFDRFVGHLLRARERSFGPLVREALGQRHFAYYANAWLVPIHDHIQDSIMHESLTTALVGLQESEASAIGEAGEYVKLMLLRYRGRAWWFLGRHGLARADLERAVGLGQRLLTKAAVAGFASHMIDARAEVERAYALLAAIEAVAGHEDRALQHARAAVGVSATPHIALDLLLLRPELAAIRDKAAWSNLLTQPATR